VNKLDHLFMSDSKGHDISRLLFIRAAAAPIRLVDGGRAAARASDKLFGLGGMFLDLLLSVAAVARACATNPCLWWCRAIA